MPQIMKNFVSLYIMYDMLFIQMVELIDNMFYGRIKGIIECTQLLYIALEKEKKKNKVWTKNAYKT